MNVGASRWAIATYTHPRFDGIFVRMTTLMENPYQRVGSSSGCTDYWDGYVALPRRRLEAARFVAKARHASTAQAALAFAQQAVAADPTWQWAQAELRRRERKAR